MDRKLSFTLIITLLCLFFIVEIQSPTQAESLKEVEAPEEEYSPRFTNYLPPQRAPFQDDDPIIDEEPQGIEGIYPVPYTQIVFEAIENENWEIFVADGGGNNPYRVTYDNAIDIHPELNRGCTKIVFASDRMGNFDIFSMNLDGSSLTQLTSDATDDVNPSWSPDGTRIVFEAYRDGQPEIYIMNADGSDETKITWDPDFDGTPTWSRDGTQIAFTSRRTGGYRIWTMNPDGSALMQRTDIPYSFHPAWSPDGKVIAFDADSNADGFQEAWGVSLESNTYKHVPGNGNFHDYLIDQFSPDGKFLAYTLVNWIYYQDNWYWTYSQPSIVDAGSFSNKRILIDKNTAWYLDWKSVDTHPPTSSMFPLPVESPYYFELQWSGSDDFPVIIYYDIQVKEGIGGAWTNFIDDTYNTNISGSGIGGQDLYFRARARDSFYNYEEWPSTYETHTRIEAYPPSIKFDPAPRFYQKEVVLSWSGKDIGGSGIKYYELQSRNETEGGDWWNILEYSQDTSYTFKGYEGNTYSLRVRATDNAENVLPWEEADTIQVSHYDWRVDGVILDNTETPIYEGVAEVITGYLGSELSDSSGRYSAYGGANHSEYLGIWYKDGYSSLPETKLDGSRNQIVDEFLPPADNMIQNWGFEEGDFSIGDWITSGTITPSLVNVYQHTGSNSAMLGLEPKFSAEEKINSYTNDASIRGVVRDTSGNSHFLWHTDYHGLLYRFRTWDGIWSTPELFSPAGEYSGVIKISADDSLHVFWVENQKLYYTAKTSDGSWSSPVIISGNDAVYDRPPAIGIDSMGGIHAAWLYVESNLLKLHYSVHQNDTWSIPDLITVGLYVNYNLDIDGEDRIHITWVTVSNEIKHIWRNLEESWRSISTISESVDSSQFETLPSELGNLHVVWIYDNELYYRMRSYNGLWSGTTEFGPAQSPTILLDQEMVYLVWSQRLNPTIMFTRLNSEGEWIEPIAFDSLYEVGEYKAGMDTNNRLHVAIRYNIAGQDDNLGYSYITNDDHWSSPVFIRHIGEFFVISKAEFDEPGSIFMVIDKLRQQFYTEAVFTVGGDGDSRLSTGSIITESIDYPALSYLYNLWCPGNAVDSKFEVSLTNGLITETLTSTTGSTSGWQHAWHALESWKGKSIKLNFEIQQAAGDSACRAVIDEVTLGSSYPDLWVEMNAADTVQPGETIEYQLHVGNRGGAPASSSALTLTLPTEMTFISADLEPTSVGDSVVWDLGILPGKSEPLAITVIARLESMPESGFYISSSIAIGSGTMELELHNNLVQVISYTAMNTYLPLVNE